MNMIEKVARAIWEQPLGDMDEITGENHPRIVSIARAAIEAMKVPTEAMNKAGIEAWGKSPMAVSTQFTAMITAALEDGE